MSRAAGEGRGQALLAVQKIKYNKGYTARCRGVLSEEFGMPESGYTYISVTDKVAIIKTHAQVLTDIIDQMKWDGKYFRLSGARTRLFTI